MDAYHDRLARVALTRAGAYGFALAGGYAVQAHGFLERPSEDVDLFTTMEAEDRFPAAVAEVIEAFKEDGLDVEQSVVAEGFARLVVFDPRSGHSSQVELGIDWRAHPPTVLNIGPVLHPDDAVANKVTALFSRAQARDFIDVHAALSSGRYDGEALLRLALEHDPGFDRGLFSQSLTSITRLPDAEFAAYGIGPHEIAELRAAMAGWATQISRGNA